MIEAVLFDYGGVLTDGGRDGSTDVAVAEFFGLKQVDLSELHDQYGRGAIGTKQFLKALNQKYGRRKKKITAEDYLALNSIVFTPLDAVHGLAEAIRSQGILTGIVSNVNQLIADELAASGCYSQFHPVILSHEVGARKPEPEIYEIALRGLDITAENVIFVDDNPKNLEPARQLGMFTVHAHSQKQLLIAIPKAIEYRGLDQAN